MSEESFEDQKDNEEINKDDDDKRVKLQMIILKKI